MPLRRLATILFVLTLAASPLAAQNPDGAHMVDTLSNGMRVIVLHNATPANRIELRLGVDAGSVHEDSTQRGLAHFVEHMAFNGTRRFARQQIQDWMQSMGMQFGADLNATTSRDETVYRLTIPADRPDALPTAVQVLADWASGLEIDSITFERERGILVGEWRSRGGSNGSVQDRYSALLLAGTPYVGRLPIGDEATLRGAPVSELRRFYTDWYRPERMVVAIVGAFPPAARDSVMQLVRSELGAIPRSATPARPEPMRAVPKRPHPVADVVVVPGARVTEVHAYFPLAPGKRDTTITVRERGLRAAQRNLEMDMVAALLNERLKNLPAGERRALGDVRVAFEEPVRGERMLTLHGAAPEHDARTALAELMAVVEQVRQHGFDEKVFTGARDWFLGRRERRFAPGVALDSRMIANSWIFASLRASTLVEAAVSLEASRAALAGADRIENADLRDSAQTWFREPGRAFFVTTPGHSHAPPPSPAELVAVSDSVARVAYPAPARATAAGAAPLAVAPAPGKIVGESRIDAIGALEWRLSNGARVVLRPAPLEQGEVLLHARAPGGLSLAPDSAYISALLSTDVLATGGLGTHARDAVVTRLREVGPTVRVTPFVRELEHGVTAKSAPAHVGALLQVVNLVFTAPRADSAAAAAYVGNLRERLASGTPIASLLRYVLANGHARRRPLTAAMAESFDIQEALAFRRARYADAANFTFYIVGTFDPDSVRPLVEQWIGGLPGSGPTARNGETWRDLGISTKQGPGRVNLSGGPAGKVTTRLIMHGSLGAAESASTAGGAPVGYDRATTYVISAMGEILERRLMARLRSTLGATYSVSVSASTTRWPQPTYEIGVAWDAAPEEADSLAEEAIATIRELAEHGPTAEEVAEMQALFRRRFENARATNEYWLNAMLSAEWNGWPLTDGIHSVEAEVAAVTVDRVRAVARALLELGKIVRIDHRP